MTNVHQTPEPVIFRRWKRTKDIFALFPAWPADCGTNADCCSYEHVGGHGAANFDLCIKQSVQATKREYAELKEELIEKGFSLEIYTLYSWEKE